MYWWFGGLVAKSCPTLGTPWTVACQAPLSMVFPRQEYWGGLQISSSGDLPKPRSKPRSPALTGGFLRDSHLCCAGLCLGTQSCPTLSDPMDCSLPVTSVLGDSPGKRSGLSCSPPGDLPNPRIKPRSPTLPADSLPAALPGKQSHLLHRSYLRYNLRNLKKINPLRQLLASLILVIVKKQLTHLILMTLKTNQIFNIFSFFF